LAENGNQKIKIGYSAYKKPIIVKTETKDFGLIMPIQKIDSKFIISERINLPDGLNENGLSAPGLNSLFKNEGLKEPATNPAWFPQYLQFKNKPKQAIQHLMKVKKGDCISALYREDIGYIDIVWGENDSNNKGFGLKHIIEKHGKEIAELGFKVEDFIPIIVQFGEFKIAEKTDKIYLEGKMFRMVLSKTNKKTFVLSAFDLRPMWKKEKSKGLNGTYDGINFKDFPLQNPTLNFSKKLRKTNKSVYGNGFKMPPLYSTTSISKNKGTKTIPKTKKIASSVPVSQSVPTVGQIKPISDTGKQQNNFFKVNGNVGKFLQQVERKPFESVVITLDGMQGAGKTTTLYKFIDAFGSAGNSCLFISGEEHPESALAVEKRDKYLSNEAKKHTAIVGDVESVEQLYQYVKPYDIIFIDSWQKLQRMVGNIRLDEDLRKKFNGKVFVVIFQQTTTGRTKGGAEVVFDGDIIIKMVKEASFADNYAYFDKNRYTKIPIENIRYNIAKGTVYNPNAPEVESSPTPGSRTRVIIS